jgi:predicted phage terminase large subunit-like protein
MKRKITNRAEYRALLASLYLENFYYFLPLAHAIVTPGTDFVDAVHARAIATAAEKVVRGESRRLLISVPPRHFKSFIGSVALVAWALAVDPTLRIICASYGDDLAKEFAIKTRDIMASEEYGRLFPQTVLDQTLQSNLRTTAKGYRMATSVKGTVTGRGADLIIVDDPLKALEGMNSAVARDTVYEWVTGSLMSRFDKPAAGRMIVIMQRLHQDDLIGRLLDDGGWEYLELPSRADRRIELDIGEEKPVVLYAGDLLFSERFDEAVLKEKEQEAGERLFSAQYLQRPIPDGGAVVKLDWFPRYDVEDIQSFDRIIQSWDTASSIDANRDYSVCTTWGIRGTSLYLIDVYRARLTVLELLHKVVWLKGHFGASYAIIETGNGTPLLQQLWQNGHPWAFSSNPTLSKEERFNSQVLKLQQGMVHLPQEADWLKDFEDELCQFPHGRYDDQVDSMVQLLSAIDKPGANRILAGTSFGRPGRRSMLYVAITERRSIPRRNIPRRNLR